MPAFRAGVAEARVDIGAEVTTVVVQVDGVPRFVRMLAGEGGAQVSRALVERLGSRPADAEELKRRVGTSEVDGPAARRTARMPVAAGARGSRRDRPGHRQHAHGGPSSLDYFLSSADDVAGLGRVVLSGGGAALPGLVERFGDALDIPVVLADPFAGVVVSEGAGDVDDFIPRWPSRPAWAWRRWRDGDATDSQSQGEGRQGHREPEAPLAVPTTWAVNLLPAETLQRNHERQLARRFVIAGVGAVALVGAVWPTQAAAIHMAESDLAAAEQAQADARAQLVPLQPIKSFSVAMNQQEAVIGTTMATHTSFADALDSFESAWPAGSSLRTLDAVLGAGCAGPEPVPARGEHRLHHLDGLRPRREAGPRPDRRPGQRARAGLPVPDRRDPERVRLRRHRHREPRRPAAHQPLHRTSCRGDPVTRSRLILVGGTASLVVILALSWILVLAPRLGQPAEIQAQTESVESQTARLNAEIA